MTPGFSLTSCPTPRKVSIRRHSVSEHPTAWVSRTCVHWSLRWVPTCPPLKSLAFDAPTACLRDRCRCAPTGWFCPSMARSSELYDSYHASFLLFSNRRRSLLFCLAPWSSETARLRSSSRLYRIPLVTSLVLRTFAFNAFLSHRAYGMAASVSMSISRSFSPTVMPPSPQRHAAITRPASRPAHLYLVESNIITFCLADLHGFSH